MGLCWWWNSSYNSYDWVQCVVWLLLVSVFCSSFLSFLSFYLFSFLFFLSFFLDCLWNFYRNFFTLDCFWNFFISFWGLLQTLMTLVVKPTCLPGLTPTPPYIVCLYSTWTDVHLDMSWVKFPYMTYEVHYGWGLDWWAFWDLLHNKKGPVCGRVWPL